MLNKSLVTCAVVIILTQSSTVQCNPTQSNNFQTPSHGLQVDASPITSRVGKLINSQKNVTRSDKLSSADKKPNNREFPPSARQKRNSDNDYYDYGISAASADPEELPECILSRSEFYLAWWVHENGTLKMPAIGRTGSSPGFADLSVHYRNESAIIKQVTHMTSDNPDDVIRFMSIANNELSSLPVEALELVSVSLQYLSLANNKFDTMFGSHNKTFQTWSAFPIMSNLKELDLRNCSLSSLEYNIFDNLFNLEKLFLSHNHLSVISTRNLMPLKYRLVHLDLSYNEVHLLTPYGMTDPFSEYLNGMMIDEEAFSQLDKLTFLDLSHTKLKQESTRALKNFNEKLEQLSLCYTKIPLMDPFMFNRTNLKVLDLSGNTNLNSGLLASWFGGLERKLEILVFRDSYIKNVLPLRNLRKLRMLDLANNNINQINPTSFQNFNDLEILDLKINHISNWYERVFETNEKLKILNLRNNNINLLTPEMMSDFEKLQFLAIGANNFVCDCILHEFIERAKFNARVHQCKINSRRLKRSIDIPEEHQDPKYHYNVFLRMYYSYFTVVDESCKKIIGNFDDEFSRRKRVNEVTSVSPEDCDSIISEGELKDFSMTFDFLLLDYNENDYHCIESDGLSKPYVPFNNITGCVESNRRSTDGSVSISTPAYNEGEEDDFTEKPDENSANNLLIIYVSVGVPMTLAIFIWFWKRKDIKYFCTIFKNTLILSLDKGDKKALMMTNRRRKSNNQVDDSYTYDVFVSYCDKDRDWVLDHLIPNIEKRSEVTICLHERDFQVGLSILENIIQCMDQSRCLLLVISESFLKSNWCSFEMHLAQHRLIETRREQLILVLLQDIPKSKRPRTLNFLMRTKTYIMWPNEDKKELRNVFWKRLKKAIVLNNWDSDKSEKNLTRPRHSIV